MDLASLRSLLGVLELVEYSSFIHTDCLDMPISLIHHVLYIGILYSSKLNKKQRLHLYAYLLYVVFSLGGQA